MSSVFSGSYRCEQLFSSMKSVKPKTGTRVTDERLERCIGIVATEIKPDIEGLLEPLLLVNLCEHI
jgi:hypothetical protein